MEKRPVVEQKAPDEVRYSAGAEELAPFRVREDARRVEPVELLEVGDDVWPASSDESEDAEASPGLTAYVLASPFARTTVSCTLGFQATSAA